jgi:hypothetical protein
MSILRQSKCRAMAQAVSHLSLNAEARVRSVSVRVGFVVEKVALGQVSLRGLRFFSVSILPPWRSMLIYHLKDKQQAS